MNNLSIEVGRVVKATAGRDKNKVFIIVQIVDGQHVLISDGKFRRLSAPKKKKIKHLEFKPQVLRGIKAKLVEGKKVFDAELRSAINSLEDSEQPLKKED